MGADSVGSMATRSDTSPDVADAQRERLASMSVAERAELLVGMCQAVTDMAIAGIKLEHPNATQDEIRSQLLLRRYGPEFVASLPAELR